MRPIDYFPKQFLIDITNFDSVCLCGMTMETFRDNQTKWPYLEHFLICQYELNLIHQSIYDHFREDYKEWCRIGILPTDARCHHGGVSAHPIAILEVAEKKLPEYGLSEKITAELLLEYDLLFLNYIENVCSEAVFSTLTLEALKSAMISDPDNQKVVVSQYLKSKLNRQDKLRK